jgi:hypothetical protein
MEMRFVGVILFLGCLALTSCSRQSNATRESTSLHARASISGKWKNDKHVIEFRKTTAVVDGKTTCYSFDGHGWGPPPLYLHLGKQKTNEFDFEVDTKAGVLVLTFLRHCGRQIDIDEDDNFENLSGEYRLTEEKAATPDTKLQSVLLLCTQKKAKLLIIIKNLEGEKIVKVQELAEMGIKSLDDLKGKPDAQLIARELAYVVQERERVKKLCDEMTAKIFQINSLIRRLELQSIAKDSSVPEKEIEEVLVGVDDTLDDGTPKAARSAEIGEILDKELKGEKMLRVNKGGFSDIFTGMSFKQQDEVRKNFHEIFPKEKQ